MKKSLGNIIKQSFKNILWFLIPKKNGSSVLKVLGGPAKGCKLNLDIRKEGSYWAGNYDQWIFDSIPFDKYIQPGDVVWDGGAYVGYYTAIFRKLSGNTGKVYTFEASAKNYERLKKLPQINKWNNVFIYNIAIGPEHTNIKFVNSRGGSNGPYGLDKDYKENDIQTLNITEVQSCGVDELVYEKNIAEPDFIKFDLESAEEYALKNGDRLYSKKRPLILLELHGEKARESAGIFLEKYNYEAILVFGFKNRHTVIRTVSDFNKLKEIPHMIICLPL